MLFADMATGETEQEYAVKPNKHDQRSNPTTAVWSTVCAIHGTSVADVAQIEHRRHQCCL